MFGPAAALIIHNVIDQLNGSQLSPRTPADSEFGEYFRAKGVICLMYTLL